MHRPVGTDNEHLAIGRPSEDRDGEIGIALGDESELRSRAETDIDRIGAEALLQLRAAVEIDLLDIDAMRFEEALLYADIERHEGEHLGLRLADAERARAGRRGETPPASDDERGAQ